MKAALLLAQTTHDPALTTAVKENAVGKVKRISLGKSLPI